MLFKMNNHEWKIVEESKQIVKEKYEEATKEETIEVFGLTNFCEQKIYINQDMSKDLKKHTKCMNYCIAILLNIVLLSKIITMKK